MKKVDTLVIGSGPSGSITAFELINAKRNVLLIEAGSALEEAITIDQQEERIEKMMDKVGTYYSRKGQTHRWVKIKKEAAKIEKKREVKRKANAAARLAANQEEEMLIHDLAKLFLYLVGTITVIAGVVFLIFGSGAE